MQLLVLAMRIR